MVKAEWAFSLLCVCSLIKYKAARVLIGEQWIFAHGRKPLKSQRWETNNPWKNWEACNPNHWTWRWKVIRRDGFAEQRDLVGKEKRKPNHRIISLGDCREETEPEAGVRQETYALCRLFFFFCNFKHFYQLRSSCVLWHSIPQLFSALWYRKHAE